MAQVKGASTKKKQNSIAKAKSRPSKKRVQWTQPGVTDKPSSTRNKGAKAVKKLTRKRAAATPEAKAKKKEAINNLAKQVSASGRNANADMAAYIASKRRR